MNFSTEALRTIEGGSIVFPSLNHSHFYYPTTRNTVVTMFHNFFAVGFADECSIAYVALEVTVNFVCVIILEGPKSD